MAPLISHQASANSSIDVCWMRVFYSYPVCHDSFRGETLGIPTSASFNPSLGLVQSEL
jgi:hypothetical protein